MTYDYHCEKCLGVWEMNLPMTKRDQPLDEPCPECGKDGMVKRGIACPGIQYQGTKSPQTRAGRHFNDVLKNISKNHPQQLRDGTKQTMNFN